MTDRLTFGEILSDAREIIRRNAGMLAGCGAAILAVYVGIDFLPAEAALVANLVPSIIVGLFVQYLVVARLLADRIGADVKRRGNDFGALFGASFLGGLAILIGFAVFILPGIYLLARWSASSSFVIAEGESATGALSASWRATGEGHGQVFLVYLVYCASVAAVFAAIFLLAEGLGLADESLPVSIAANTLAVAINLSGWVLGAAIYRLSKPADQPTVAVFD